MTAVTFLRPYARPPWRTRAEHDLRPRDGREDFESAAFYNPGETAGFPDDEAAWLITYGIATPTSNTDGGIAERTHR